MKINYQLLFEKSPGLYLVLDSYFKIVAATDAYLNATLTHREAIIFKNIFDVFPDNPEDKSSNGVQKLKLSLEKVVQSKKANRMSIQKYDIRTDSGKFEERFWSPYNIPILDDQGNVALIIHSVEDVTSLINSKKTGAIQKQENLSLHTLNHDMSIEIYKRISEIDEANLELKRVNEELKIKSEQLQLSNDELALFAETAAHDIKAPFRNIGGHLEIIAEKMKACIEDEELEDSLVSIHESRKRITLLLDDLLKFARVTRAADPKVEVDLNKLMSEVISNLNYIISEKAAQIDYPENLPLIKGVYIQIFQLFQNLINNSIKFCKVQPIIKIQFWDAGREIHFSVKDNGIGIDKKYHEKIFEPFERLNSSKSFPGSGLGLAICKRIIEHHDGHIWITSDDTGTEFHFTLPKL